MSLSGHTALVTGSGRSLGRAIALRFAQEGANVIVNSRSTPDECEETASLCRDHGVRSIGVVADVGIRDGVDKLAEAAQQEFGYVDILVNNVGISPHLPFLEMSEDDWHTVFAANLDSMFFCCQAFIPGMVERNWGRILNVTGLAARQAGPYPRGIAAHVGASKAGAVGFTRAIGNEFAAHGITCNEVGPGVMDTEPRRNKYYSDKAVSRPNRSSSIDPNIPVGRIGGPDELAAACAFLASEEASYITRQSILVNGGLAFG